MEAHQKFRKARGISKRQMPKVSRKSIPVQLKLIKLEFPEGLSGVPTPKRPLVRGRGEGGALKFSSGTTHFDWKV